MSSTQKSEAKNGRNQETVRRGLKEKRGEIIACQSEAGPGDCRGLGDYENISYNWRRKYTAEGDKTKYDTLEEENRDLQRQLAEIKIVLSHYTYGRDFLIEKGNINILQGEDYIESKYRELTVAHSLISDMEIKKYPNILYILIYQDGSIC